MDIIENLAAKVSTFDLSIDRILIDLAKEHDRLIVKMNTDQLYKGIDSDGNEITPSYTPFTVDIKRQKNQPYDRVTLKDTGDFHDSFLVRFNDDSFELDATDRKKPKIDRKYGESIYGLTDDNITKLTESLKDDFVQSFRKAIEQ